MSYKTNEYIYLLKSGSVALKETSNVFTLHCIYIQWLLFRIFRSPHKYYWIKDIIESLRKSILSSKIIKHSPTLYTKKQIKNWITFFCEVS